MPAIKTMSLAERVDQQLADDIFNTLETFERSNLAVFGTAFTTYEDEGNEVCAWLEQRARAWRVADMTQNPQKYTP